MRSIGLEEYIAKTYDACSLVLEEITLSVIEKPVLPARKPVSHKYSYGRALIIGGSTGFSGAPALTANACERSGAGLTHLMVPESIYPIAAVKCDGAVVTPLPSGDDGRMAKEALDAILPVLEKADACAVGPGLGQNEAARRIVENVIKNAGCPLVLDADALTACGKNMDVLNGCQVPTVLTPHEGEFRRIGGDLSQGRLQGALAFSKEFRNAVLVLKGYGTLVCRDGEASVNLTGGPALAKGGSGDVLCGILCALLAQGFSKQKVSGNDNEMVSLFTSDTVAYSVVYFKDKMHMVMRQCAMTDEGPDNDWKTLATWMFDPDNDTTLSTTVQVQLP